MIARAAEGPVVGLFGKLPAHGDFVRRGWDDATIDAIDDWLTLGIAALRDGLDDAAFAARMYAAPLWQGYVPPGLLGPLALHLGMAPSIDRAGRLFPIAAGVAGDADAIWATTATATGCGAAIGAAIYDALAGGTDADTLVAAIGTIGDAAPASTPAPTAAAWWRGPREDRESAVSADRVDAALLERLLGEGQA